MQKAKTAEKLTPQNSCRTRRDLQAEQAATTPWEARQGRGMRHRTAAVRLGNRGPINQMQIVTSVSLLLLH